jgi:hypothetical protein
MEEEFRARRLEERRRAAYFVMRCEMDREQEKEKWEERSWKCEKAHRAKEAFARGGDNALLKGKWSRLTQDW